jgi:hypothetical protein
MYVAPLNYDLFFKKVFSNKHIAKRFLEDLLNVTIKDIKLLSVENKITDASVVVKFDFRCKIKGKYVVIEMQQSYKTDVVKRFYMYHSVSTALQLETLKPRIQTKQNGETYTEKNYSELDPVITLIWMVDDMLGFEDDFIAYTTLPEAAKDFILNEKLWGQSLKNILAERKNIVKTLENNTKGLGFLTESRIIFVFQRNIIKNQKMDLPYFKWFDVANISRNLNNTEKDFANYKNDKDMAEVINRIRKDKLTPDEFHYVSDIYLYEIHNQELKEKLAKQEKHAKKNMIKAEQEKIKAEQNAKIILVKFAKHLFEQGKTISAIADELNVSIDETNELLKIN